MNRVVAFSQLFESLKMAVAALVANKLRAVLTTLGVVIGITFVLLMGWLLSGLDRALEDTLSIFGDDILYVDKFDWTGGGNWLEQRNRKDISYQQFLKVRDRLHSAEHVVPTARNMQSTIRYGDTPISNATMFGVTSEYIQMLGGNLNEGRFFNESEDASGALVAVLGYNIVQGLFSGSDPLGKTITIHGLPFKVIGAMPKRGALGADFVDNQVIIPIRRFFNMYGNRSRIVINIKAGGAERLDDVRYETIGVLREVRSLEPGTKDDFSINTQEQFRKQTDQFRFVVWGVGLAMTGLSFLVGSIGIMNIMFVSVTERTREIGIRKAVGATRRSILLQFLVEAIFLCLIGCVFGVLITSIAAFIGSKYADVTFLSPFIPLSQIAVAVLVSVVVGVLAGMIPAFRAARMDPVEALRAD